MLPILNDRDLHAALAEGRTTPATALAHLNAEIERRDLDDPRRKDAIDDWDTIAEHSRRGGWHVPEPAR